MLEVTNRRTKWADSTRTRISEVLNDVWRVWELLDIAPETVDSLLATAHTNIEERKRVSRRLAEFAVLELLASASRAAQKDNESTESEEEDD